MFKVSSLGSTLTSTPMMATLRSNQILLPSAPLLRTFSKTTGKEGGSPMAGRFKPKQILNFDAKGNYLLYNSDFALAGRAMKENHPKSATAVLFVGSVLFAMACMAGLVNNYRKGVLWKKKFRCLILGGFTVFCAKNMHRIWFRNRIISTISLRQDGKTLEIANHFPFSL